MVLNHSHMVFYWAWVFIKCDAVVCVIYLYRCIRKQWFWYLFACKDAAGDPVRECFGKIESLLRKLFEHYKAKTLCPLLNASIDTHWSSMIAFGLSMMPTFFLCILFSHAVPWTFSFGIFGCLPFASSFPLGVYVCFGEGGNERESCSELTMCKTFQWPTLLYPELCLCQALKCDFQGYTSSLQHLLTFGKL